MYYGDSDPRLDGDKTVSVHDHVAEMSAHTAELLAVSQTQFDLFTT